VCTSMAHRHAFDKAVRRKPPVVAADAGPMQIQLREGAVSRCAEAVRAEHDRRHREMTLAKGRLEKVERRDL
jgi:hypothetical protein